MVSALRWLVLSALVPAVTGLNVYTNGVLPQGVTLSNQQASGVVNGVQSANGEYVLFLDNAANACTFRVRQTNNNISPWRFDGVYTVNGNTIFSNTCQAVLNSNGVFTITDTTPGQPDPVMFQQSVSGSGPYHITLSNNGVWGLADSNNNQLYTANQVQLRHVNSQLCPVTQYNSGGSPVSSTGCTGNSQNSVWQLNMQSDTIYQLVNPSTNMCAYTKQNNNGAPVDAWPCWGDSAFNWRLASGTRPGTVQLQSVNTGMCLYIGSNGVVNAWPCWGDANFDIELTFLGNPAFVSGY